MPVATACQSCTVLIAQGVLEYSAALRRDNYGVHVIHGLQVGVFGLGAGKRALCGDQMWRLWIERTTARIRDLNSFDALARIKRMFGFRRTG